MSTEDNKAVARRYWEELHRGKGVGFGLEEDLFAPKYRHYLPGSSGPLDGKGHEHVSIAFYSGIPDAHVNVEDEIAEGDRVVNHNTLLGWSSATDKQVTITGNEISRIADGRIVEQGSQFEQIFGPQYGFVQAAAGCCSTRTVKSIHLCSLFHVGNQELDGNDAIKKLSVSLEQQQPIRRPNEGTPLPTNRP